MPTHARPARRARAVLAALALAVAVLATPAAPALAHDQLVSTDPADGAVLDVLPAAIALDFSAELLDEPNATVVEVTDATGANLAAGAPLVDGALVTQGLTGAGSGPITVLWRVVSSDGHPISGQFGFTVTAPGPTPTSTATATPTPTPTSSGPTDAETPVPSPSATPAAATAADLRPLWIGLAIAAVVVAGAVVALLVARARRGGPPGGSGTPSDR
jgi:copper resistance protein C